MCKIRINSFTWGYVIILKRSKVIWANSKSLKGKVLSFYFCSWKTLEVLTWTKIAYDLRILTQGHFGNFKVIGRKSFNLCLLYRYISYKEVWEIPASHKDFLIMTWGCVMNLTQGQLCKFRSLFKKCIIPVKAMSCNENE